MRPWTVLALLLPALSAQATEPPNPQRARLHYLQYCVGCHGADGSGAPDKGVPAMNGLLGRFMQVPGGREYLVQVPGVMNSPLNDRDVADLMNWLVPRIAPPTAATLLASPYTASEIARLRQTRPADVMGTRRALLDAAPPGP
jgi:mono/diheme cytochrome c family protein